jgi:hypothetical protein
MYFFALEVYIQGFTSTQLFIANEKYVYSAWSNLSFFIRIRLAAGFSVSLGMSNI